MHRCLTILSILAAVILTDAHWAVMQTISWAKMVHSENAVEPNELFSNVINVVSGQSPCEHCKAISKERESEDEEILDMISKTVTLAPISFAREDFRFPEETDMVWFSSATNLTLSGISDDIEHPPRA